MIYCIAGNFRGSKFVVQQTLFSWCTASIKWKCGGHTKTVAYTNFLQCKGTCSQGRFIRGPCFSVPTTIFLPPQITRYTVQLQHDSSYVKTSTPYTLHTLHQPYLSNGPSCSTPVRNLMCHMIYVLQANWPQVCSALIVSTHCMVKTSTSYQPQNSLSGQKRKVARIYRLAGGNTKKRGNKKSGESVTPIHYNVIHIYILIVCLAFKLLSLQGKD